MHGLQKLVEIRLQHLVTHESIVLLQNRGVGILCVCARARVWQCLSLRRVQLEDGVSKHALGNSSRGVPVRVTNQHILAAIGGARPAHLGQVTLHSS